MPDTWGTYRLKVTEDRRPAARVNLTEKPLLPDPTNRTGPQSVLFGTGRQRQRRAIKGLATRTDFNALETDYLSMTKRTAQFADGFSMMAVIEDLTGEERLGSEYVFYSATFVEV